MQYTDQYGETYDLTFVKSEYTLGGLAIIAYCEDGPYATVTVWLDEPVTNERCAYLDTNNCGHLIGWLIKKGYVRQTFRYARSGFCEYPEGMFDEEFLNTL